MTVKHTSERNREKQRDRERKRERGKEREKERRRCHESRANEKDDEGTLGRDVEGGVRFRIACTSPAEEATTQEKVQYYGAE